MNDRKQSFPRTIREIHDAFDGGVWTPLSLTQAYFQNISKSQHHAYLTLNESEALATAQKQTDDLVQKFSKKAPRRHFPLFGIPFGIKDILVTEGLRTTAASKMLENYIPPYTATAVQKLKNAGAIILGKLNLDEFAMGSSNENSAFGPTLHPTHSDRVPGGSSGASATAVAADLCFASLGTDTGGSIRLPASFCGIVGIKPTYGRVSRYGQIAFASSLDQIGPMTKTVEDSAKILEVLAGHDPMDCTTVDRDFPTWESLSKTDFKNLRIGIPKEYWEGQAGSDGIASEVRQKIETVLQKAKALGATLVPVSLPHTAYAVSTYYVVAVSEASSNLSRFDGVRFGVRPPSASAATNLDDFYKKSRSLFGAEVKRRILLGTFALSSGYYEAYYKRACQVRRLMREDFERAFQSVDVIVSPVSPTTAFKLGEKSKDPLRMYLTDVFTIPASMAGLPCMSLPMGNDAENLPVGMHLIAGRYQEKTLLEAAIAMEGL